MNPWPAASGVYRLPAQGERVRISGTVKWDTDYEWWYEIHPTGPEDVEFLQPRPTLSLRVSYPTPTAIRKDKGVYHWPGLSSVPADFGDTCKAQDFTYQALYYSDHPRVELLISAPGRPVRWFIENEQIQQGSGSVSVIPTGNHASTLPPLNGTAFPGAPVTITYQLSGDALDLGNVPDDGNYDVRVRAETDDEVGVVTAGAWVSFKGDEFQMDPAYRKTSELCRAAAVLARGNYRTSPLPVPKYDPQSWAQVPEEQLRSIWQALQRAVSEHRGVELTAEDTDPETLTRQVHATLVAYPEVAARMSNLLPERIARHLSEFIPGAS
jgi:hypothetical protein